MARKGRKSAASRAVTVQGKAEIVRRPMAPRLLSDEEADVWRETVQAMPADWFPGETHRVLIAYCRHVVRADRITDIIEKFEQSQPAGEIPPLEAYGVMLRMLQAETRHILSAATKMRLTQQSTLKREDKSKGVGKRPWEA